MGAKRKLIDREKLELDYRAGIKTFRQMSVDHGLAASRIKQIADEEKWERDLAKRIQQVAEAKLNKSLLNANPERSPSSPEKRATEAQIVDAGANEVFKVRLAHRAAIGRSRELVANMLAELEVQSVSGDQLRSLLAGIADCSEEGVAQAKELAKVLDRTLKLGDRAAVLKTLVESLSRLVAAEREAYNIGKDAELTDPFSEFLRGLQARAVPVVADPPADP